MRKGSAVFIVHVQSIVAHIVKDHASITSHGEAQAGIAVPARSAPLSPERSYVGAQAVIVPQRGHLLVEHIHITLQATRYAPNPPENELLWTVDRSDHELLAQHSGRLPDASRHGANYERIADDFADGRPRT
jgi:hypothetical protein